MAEPCLGAGLSMMPFASGSGEEEAPGASS